MRNSFRLLTSLLITWVGMAQEPSLRGIITDANEGTPLSGATILINGSLGVTTAADGSFQIACLGTAELKISYVGYKTWQKSISCSDVQLLEIELETEIEQLQSVEITATSLADKSLLVQPNSLVKLNVSALGRTTGLFFEDAINTNVPGVTMNRRTQSGGQQFNIRGYGNGMGVRGVSSNFDGQGVKVYLDGIPITDAEGITILDDIDYQSIQAAEILKGPSGTLYGMAIAGVINLQTQQAPLDESSVRQDLTVGSYGLIRSTTRLQTGGNKGSLLASYGRQSFNGFMPHTQSDKEFANLSGRMQFNEQQKLSLYVGVADSYDQRNGELTIYQYQEMDYSGNPDYIKNNAHSAVRTFRAGVSHTYAFSEKLINTTTFFGSVQNIDNSSAGGWTDKHPLNFGLRSVFENRTRISDQISLSGISGLELQKMFVQTVGYKMGRDNTNPEGYNVITDIKSNQTGKNTVQSFFTQWTIGFPYDLSLTAGVGLNSQHLLLEDRLWGLTSNFIGSQRLPIFERHFQNLVSPSLAVNKKIESDISVYASWTTGQKAPVGANILIATTGELNASLTPEQGNQFEVGTKGEVLNNRLFYTLALFNTKFQNKLTAVTVQNPENTATLYSYLVNGGGLKNNGLEIQAYYRGILKNSGGIKRLDPFINGTFSNFKYVDYTFERAATDANNQPIIIVDDYSGNPVAGAAPVVFNTGIDFELQRGFYGNATYNYRNRMPFTSDGANYANAFAILNAKIGLKKEWSAVQLDVYAGAVNLTGRQYYNMVFVNQLPDAYVPAPNVVNFYGGLRLNYGF